jgi:hypothetical protein
LGVLTGFLVGVRKGKKRGVLPLRVGCPQGMFQRDGKIFRFFKSFFFMMVNFLLTIIL